MSRRRSRSDPDGINPVTDVQCIAAMLAGEDDDTPMNRYKGCVEGCELDANGLPVAGSPGCCCCMGEDAQNFCCTVTDGEGNAQCVCGSIESDGQTQALESVNRTLGIIARILAGDTGAVSDLEGNPARRRCSDRYVTLCSDYSGPRSNFFQADCSGASPLSSLDSDADQALMTTGPFTLAESGSLSVILSNLDEDRREFEVTVFDLTPPEARILHAGDSRFVRIARLEPGGTANITWTPSVPAGLPIEIRITPGSWLTASVGVTYVSGASSILFHSSDWVVL